MGDAPRQQEVRKTHPNSLFTRSSSRLSAHFFFFSFFPLLVFPLKLRCFSNLLRCHRHFLRIPNFSHWKAVFGWLSSQTILPFATPFRVLPLPKQEEGSEQKGLAPKKKKIPELGSVNSFEPFSSFRKTCAADFSPQMRVSNPKLTFKSSWN